MRRALISSVARVSTRCYDPKPSLSTSVATTESNAVIWHADASYTAVLRTHLSYPTDRRAHRSHRSPRPLMAVSPLSHVRSSTRTCRQSPTPSAGSKIRAQPSCPSMPCRVGRRWSRRAGYPKCSMLRARCSAIRAASMPSAELVHDRRRSPCSWTTPPLPIRSGTGARTAKGTSSPHDECVHRAARQRWTRRVRA